MQGLITTENKIVVNGEANTSLNHVHNVIVAYYEAKKAASVGGYEGIQAAKQKIATAKKYALMSPINCTDLVSRLNSVSSRLEQAHYSYLAGQVERLRPYYNYSQTEYDNLSAIEKEYVTLDDLKDYPYLSLPDIDEEEIEYKQENK